jgi:hypothetical protein
MTIQPTARGLALILVRAMTALLAAPHASLVFRAGEALVNPCIGSRHFVFFRV